MSDARYLKSSVKHMKYLLSSSVQMLVYSSYVAQSVRVCTLRIICKHHTETVQYFWYEYVPVQSTR